MSVRRLKPAATAPGSVLAFFLGETSMFGTALTSLWGLLRQRCPRCLRGNIFSGTFLMNDPCPVCGLIFQREEGSFLGAMYVSYLLGSVLMFSAYFAGRWLFPDWGDLAIVAGVLLVYLPLVPAVFRYSRTVWIYLERWVCPGDLSATIYEKTRRQEFDRAGRGDIASPPLPPDDDQDREEKRAGAER
jgi:uncharacterized protein (DUF983 family)